MSQRNLYELRASLQCPPEETAAELQKFIDEGEKMLSILQIQGSPRAGELRAKIDFLIKLRADVLACAELVV